MTCCWARLSSAAVSEVAGIAGEAKDLFLALLVTSRTSPAGCGALSPRAAGSSLDVFCCFIFLPFFATSLSSGLWRRFGSAFSIAFLTSRRRSLLSKGFFTKAKAPISFNWVRAPRFVGRYHEHRCFRMSAWTSQDSMPLIGFMRISETTMSNPPALRGRGMLSTLGGHNFKSRCLEQGIENDQDRHFIINCDNRATPSLLPGRTSVVRA